MAFSVRFFEDEADEDFTTPPEDGGGDVQEEEEEEEQEEAGAEEAGDFDFGMVVLLQVHDDLLHPALYACGFLFSTQTMG